MRGHLSRLMAPFSSLEQLARHSNFGSQHRAKEISQAKAHNRKSGHCPCHQVTPLCACPLTQVEAEDTQDPVGVHNLGIRVFYGLLLGRR